MEISKKIKHIIGRMLTSNNFNIDHAFKTIKERNWDTIYVFVDIHGTVLYPDYGKVAKEYYPMAKEVLYKLTTDPRIKLVLYTCSYPHEIDEYLVFFAKDGIVFDYVNKNPEVANTRGGYFEDKPYMNILFEDKAGFVGEYDWYVVDKIFKRHINKKTVATPLPHVNTQPVNMVHEYLDHKYKSCIARVDDGFPNSIFFDNHGVTLFELNTKKKYFWVRFTVIWLELLEICDNKEELLKLINEWLCIKFQLNDITVKTKRFKGETGWLHKNGNN
jgi:hypothetical protein